MAFSVLSQAGPSKTTRLVAKIRTSKSLERSSLLSTSSRQFFTSTRTSAPDNELGKDKTHYQTLGIAPGASRMEVKAAYFRLSKRYHPDVRKSGNEDMSTDAKATERFHEVSNAYKVLSDDRQRRAYDRTLSSSPVSSMHRSHAHTSHTPGSSSSYAYTYEVHARRRRGATHAWESGPRGHTGRTHPQYTHPQYAHAHATGTGTGTHYDPSSPSQSSSSSPFSQSTTSASGAATGSSIPKREERLTGRQARAEEERKEHDRIVRESNLGRFLRALGIILVVSWVGGLGRSLGG